MAGRNYSDEEVDAIFRRALERQQAESDGLGHEELLAAAKEIGLDERALERAVHEVEDDRAEKSLVEQVRSNKRAAFFRHLFAYLIIAGGMTALHLLGATGAWVWWVVFGWGAGVALSLPRAFRAPSDAELEKAHQKRSRVQRRRERIEARQRERARREQEAIERERHRQQRQSERRRTGKSELDQVVEEGVALLLRVAANKLRDANQQLANPKPPTEFDRYVDSKKSGASPAPRQQQAQKQARPAQQPPPRVRVQSPSDDEMHEELARRARDRDRRRR